MIRSNVAYTRRVLDGLPESRSRLCPQVAVIPSFQLLDLIHFTRVHSHPDVARKQRKGMAILDPNRCDPAHHTITTRRNGTQALNETYATVSSDPLEKLKEYCIPIGSGLHKNRRVVCQLLQLASKHKPHTSPQLQYTSISFHQDGADSPFRGEGRSVHRAPTAS